MAKKPTFNFDLAKRLVTRFKRMRHRKHFDMQVVAKQNECGTAMCIAGHALDLQGYKLRFVARGGLFAADEVVPQWTSPTGKTVRLVGSLDVAAKEMGMDRDEAHYLFHNFSLKTPKQAAIRIQKLIAEKEGEMNARKRTD